MKKRIGIMFLIVLLIAAITVSCALTKPKESQVGNDNTESTVKEVTNDDSKEGSKDAGKDNGIDISKELELVGYIPGEPQPGEEEVMQKLNELTKRDINATFKINYISWGDFGTKYPLVMASGEQFDFIYIANWADFVGHAQKGAFMDIKGLIEKYAPDVVRIADKDTWKSTTIKGKLYGIPTDGKDAYNNNGILYREDLRIKYNVPAIEKAEDFEAYFDAIKKNEKDMKPIDINVTDTNPLYDYMLFEKGGYVSTGLPVNSNLIGWNGLVYKIDDPKAQILSITTVPEYKYVVETMNRWYKKGYWSTSDMVNKEFSTDVNKSKFGLGKVAAWRANTGNLYTALNDFPKNHPDWKIGFYYPKSPSGNICKKDTLQNGFAVSVTSKNPERTLMFLNKMMTEKEYLWLISFGIEGRDYVLNSQGIPEVPSNAGQKPTYGFYQNAFAWSPYDAKKIMPSVSNDAEKVNDELVKRAIAPALLGMILDTNNIKPEITAVDNVLKQYESPLRYGLIKKGIEEDIEILNTNLKKAGQNKILEEVQKQADQFISENAK